MSERKVICDKCGGPRERREEKGGVRWRCMPCVRARTRAWAEAHPEEKRAADKARRDSPRGREEHRAYGVSEANKARSRTPEARAKNRIAAARHFTKHRQRVLARTQAAQKFGRERPNECPKCGVDPGRGFDGRSLIQFHHTEGYSHEKRYVGEWACTKCHGKEHRRLP